MIGFHGDLGVRLGGVRLLLRYEFDEGFSNSNGLATPLSYYRLLVGYAL